MNYLSSILLFIRMSLIVEVTSFAQVANGSDKFIEYSVSCTSTNQKITRTNGDVISSNLPWIIKHRYSNFRNLQNNLSFAFPSLQIPQCPQSGLLRSFNPVYIETKRNQLDIFMKRIVENDSLRQSNLVLAFLGIQSIHNSTSPALPPIPSPKASASILCPSLNPFSVIPNQQQSQDKNLGSFSSIGELLIALAARKQEKIENAHSNNTSDILEVKDALNNANSNDGDILKLFLLGLTKQTIDTFSVKNNNNNNHINKSNLCMNSTSSMMESKSVLSDTQLMKSFEETIQFLSLQLEDVSSSNFILEGKVAQLETENRKLKDQIIEFKSKN